MQNVPKRVGKNSPYFHWLQGGVCVLKSEEPWTAQEKQRLEMSQQVGVSKGRVAYMHKRDKRGYNDSNWTTANQTSCSRGWILIIVRSGNVLIGRDHANQMCTIQVSSWNLPIPPDINIVGTHWKMET